MHLSTSRGGAPRVACLLALAALAGAAGCGTAPPAPLPQGAAARVAAAELGPLPSGARAIATHERARFQACQRHFVARAAFPSRVVAGFRVQSALERTLGSTAVAEAVARDGRKSAHGIGTLCFALVERMTVDGRSVGRGPVPLAFLWLAAAPLDGGAPVDPRMPGDLRELLVAAWYPARGVDRALVRRAEPAAEFADLAVEPDGPRAWRVRLALPGDVVEGRIVVDARPTAPVGAGDVATGFLTVGGTGAHADTYAAYAYAGHRQAPATVTWSPGTGPLATALAEGVATFGARLPVQDGWSTRWGVYAVAP